MAANNNTTTSSDFVTIDLDATPPPSTSSPVVYPLKRQHLMPTPISQKKMLLSYKGNNSNGSSSSSSNEGSGRMFLGYNLFFLSTPIVMVFNHEVRLFKCKMGSYSSCRMGVADINKTDLVRLRKHLTDVSGSLPITTKTVKSPLVCKDGGGAETLFINLKPELAAIFNHRGKKTTVSELPSVANVKLALVISGMKTKDDEASYMMRIHQVMLKKKRVEESNDVCLFDVSEDEAEEKEVEGR